MTARRTSVMLLALTLLTAGCSTTSASPPAPAPTPAGSAASSSTASASARPVFDPPTRFDVTGRPAGTARERDLLLHQNLLFAAGANAVTVTDVLTGTLVATLAPDRTPLTEEQTYGRQVAHPPALLRTADRSVVVVPYPVTLPASGSTTAREAVELIVADATTGQRTSSVLVDAAPAEQHFSAIAERYPTVVAGNGTVVTVTIGKQITAAVDLTTGATLWRKAVRAAALLGDTVVALTPENSTGRRSIVGLGLADGVQRWSAATVTTADLAPAGPQFVVVVGDREPGGRFYALLDSRGKLSRTTNGDYPSRLACHYDQSAVTVCTMGTPLVFAIDAATGTDLWELPASGRDAPEVTAVWHGAVYGTVAGKPVVLDARTGTDKETDPGLAPIAVNGHGAVVAAQPGLTAIEFHPALG